MNNAMHNLDRAQMDQCPNCLMDPLLSSLFRIARTHLVELPEQAREDINRILLNLCPDCNHRLKERLVAARTIRPCLSCVHFHGRCTGYVCSCGAIHWFTPIFKGDPNCGGELFEPRYPSDCIGYEPEK
jgi:hypothetical protein